MNKFIQYTGTEQQTNEAIRKLALNDTKMIDLTGDNELKNLFSLYRSINPLNEDIKSKLEVIKNNEAKRYIINDCHILDSSDIEPLVTLFRENNIDMFLFSNLDPLDLNIPFTKGVSINEPLPYHDYSLIVKARNETKIKNKG